MCKKLLFLSILFSTIIMQAQWVQTNGPYGGFFTCSVVSDTYLFAGGVNGVFRSTDNGTSWTIANNGLLTTNVLSLAVSGTNLFAGTDNGGVFFSTNNGTSWTAVNNGLESIIGIVSLVVSDKNLFAGTTNGGVFLTTDNGTSWNAVNNGLPKKVSIKSLAVNGTIIFAGTVGYGVYMTNDNGASWTAVNNGLTNHFIFSLAVSGTTLLTGAGNSSTQANGVFISTNNGTNWNSANNGLTSNNNIISLAIGDSTLFAGSLPNTLYYAPTGGVFLSTDKGINWKAVNNGLSNLYIHSLSIVGNNLFAGTEAGFFLSTNNGTNWKDITPESIYNSAAVVALAASPDGSGGSNLFAATNGGIYLSTNNGTNWTKSNNGLTNFSVNSFAQSNANLFAGTLTGVYLSTDNGKNWNLSMNLDDQFVASSPTVSGGTNIYAAGNWGVGGFYYSSNEGANWNRSYTGITQYSCLAFSPKEEGIINLITANGSAGVIRSTDYGVSWIFPANSGISAGSNIYSLTYIGQNLFAGTNNGILLSTNNGTSWTAVNNGLPANAAVKSFAVSGTNLFAGINGSGVFLSTNNGASWTSVNSGSIPGTNTLLFYGTNLFAGGNGVWTRPLSQMITGVKESQNNLPTSFSLQQNFPNPFNPTTNINYSIPKSGFVTIKVYDLLGKEITSLVNENKPVGNYSVQFNASKLMSGVYFYKMQAGGFVQTKKLILLK